MSNQPWTRQRKDDKLEPMLWYRRFELYRQLGPDRSVLEIINRERETKGNERKHTTPGAWSIAANRWEWKGRAEKWDEHERQRIEAKFQADCDEWTSERFKDARALRTRARELMALPVVEEKATDDKGRQFIIKPLSSKHLRDAAAVLKDADALARITTRETLPVTKVAPTTPDGKEPYEPDRHAGQRLALLNQLVAAEQASNSGSDTNK